MQRLVCRVGVYVCIIYSEEQRRLRREHNKRVTLTRLMGEKTLNSDKFSSVSWKGVPSDVRPQVWRILLGYVPKHSSRRQSTIESKRRRYRDLVELYYDNKKDEDRSYIENQIKHQIRLDVPRTSPSLKIFQIDNIKSVE